MVLGIIHSISGMDAQRLWIRGFLGLGLTFLVLVSPSLCKSSGFEDEENSRQRSNSRIYWLRGYEGTHLRNQRDKIDQDCNVWPQAEPPQIACLSKQLEKRNSKNLRQFSKKGTSLNSASWIRNIGSLFELNLVKGISNQPPRPNNFLRGPLYSHAVVPFVSSDDDGNLVRPVPGIDGSSNLPWPLEGLRDLLPFHFNEKRLLLSPVETTAISPMPTIAPSPSAQNNYYQAPAPSPEKQIPQLGPSPLSGNLVDPGHQSVISVSPPEQSVISVSRPEQSVRNSDKSQTVVLAVIITAISTLLFSGLCFYFYLKCFSNRHRSNHSNDDKPLLLSSQQSGSLNHYYGEPNGFSWATFENANGISHNLASSETSKADGKQLSSFTRKTLRVLSLPSRVRNSTEPFKFHPLPPLPKTKASLELCDKDTFKSSASKADNLSTSQEWLQTPSSTAISSMPPLVSYDFMPQPTDVLSASHSQSTYPSVVSSTHPSHVNPVPLQPVVSTSIHLPKPPGKSPSPLPPLSKSPLPQSKSPPYPPPPSPSKSPPYPPPPSKSPPPPPMHKSESPLPPPPMHRSPPPPPPMHKSPPPPPPMHKSPPPPPPVPANGKSNVPTAPLPPVRTSQLPPVLAPRTKAGPPIPPGLEHENGNQQAKLKPFHWDKVQANADHSMVWDQIRAGSFQFNEEMIETLFGYNSTNVGASRVAKQALSTNENPQLVDPKKSQNLAILLKALSVRREEVYDALLEGEDLSSQLLEALIKMAPTRDEEKKLKEYAGDISKLGPAESFLKALLGIPSAFERMEKMLYRKNFKEEINYIQKSFETLEAACKELRSSRLFLKLLEAVLKTGNRMNVGTFRGGAQAFKLDTLLKLSDVKGTDGKTTLLHFVVQEIIRAEGVRAAHTSQQSGRGTTSSSVDGGNMSRENEEDYYRKLGLQVLANLSSDLSNVRNSASIDSDALISSISKLVTGISKLRSFLQRDFGSQPTETSTKQGNFYHSMTFFLHQAEDEIQQLQSEEKRIFSHVKDITKYFHGDAAKEEAHPFRIFVIVRDFTGMLDQVCKQVAKMQKQNPPTSSQKASSSVFLQNVPRSLFPNAFDRNADGFDDDSTY